MMVSQYDESRLLLVLQTDHAKVAGLVAAHWGNEEFAQPRPYTSMVIAAQAHDNGWWDWEIKPWLGEDGRPLDYIGSYQHIGEFRLQFFRELVNRVIRRDPYAGLVDAMHDIGLMSQGYGLLTYMADYRGIPAVDQYLREQDELTDRLIARLRADPEYAELATDEHLWTNYKLMETFDQMAQFICNRYPFNSTRRRNGPTTTLSDVPVPVGPGKDDVRITFDVQDERRAIVRPYPLDVDPLPISFPARLVPDRQYSNQDDFLRELYRGEQVTITYILQAA